MSHNEINRLNLDEPASVIRIELVRRRFYQTPKQRHRGRFAIWAVLLSIPISFVVIFFTIDRSLLNALFELYRGMTAQNWIEAVNRHWKKNPIAYLLSPIFVVAHMIQMVGVVRAPKHERLIFDVQGIRYRSPMPNGLDWIWPSWSLMWEEVKGITLIAWTLGSGIPTLSIETAGRWRRVNLLAWIDPKTFAAPTEKLFQWNARSQHVAIGEIHANPILCFLTSRGYAFDLAGLQAGATGFALEKNPQSRVMMVTFFALLAYAAIDSLIGAETYALDPPWLPMFAAGNCVALAALAWMKRGAVPWAESIVVGVLAGAAFSVALYPGLLRANQLTSEHGLQCHEYLSEGNGRLTAPNASLPDMNFEMPQEYWAPMPAATLHAIWLRHGALGFHQYDLDRMRAQWRVFFSNK